MNPAFIDNPSAVISPTLIEWYVVRCSFKNGHQKAMRLRNETMCWKYITIPELNSEHANIHKESGDSLNTDTLIILS